MRPARSVRKKKRKVLRKKICRLCDNRVSFIDFKDVDLLKRYQTEKGRILPRRITGTCFKHQKMLTQSIKRARNLSMVL